MLLPRRRRPLHATIAVAMSIGLALGAMSCSSDSSGDGARDEPTSTTKAGDDASTTTTLPDPADIEGSASDYAQALVSSLDPEDTTFTKGQVECLAPAWVDAIGVDSFKAARITPASIADQTSTISDLEISPEVASTMVSALDGCDIDTVDLLIKTSTGGAQLTESQAACFDDAVTKTAADEALAARFSGTEPDPKLLASAQACATGT